MKNRLLVAAAIGILALTVAGVSTQTAQQSGSELFALARQKENTEGNMDEAIQIYQTIVARFPTDRNLVANALLQIGLCYQKLGRTEEARNAFDLIDLEYKDQKARAEAIDHRDKLDRDLSAEQFGAIRGHVTERGRLLAARVFALKEVYTDGRRIMTSVLFTTTIEESGEWKLSPLRPGKYYVAAANVRDNVRDCDPGHLEDDAARICIQNRITHNAGRSGVYETVFFPNTPDPQRAKLVEVRPGSTTSNLDIEAALVPLRRVRGRVTGIGPFSGPENPIRGGPLYVSIMRKPELPVALRGGFSSEQVDPDGFFEFSGIPRGSYVLSVSQNYANGGHLEIEVGDRDIEDVHIAMIPGMTVPGRIVLDQQTGAAPYSFGDLGFRVMIRPEPPLELSRHTFNTRVENDGSFRFFANSVPVQKGNYRVSVTPILAPPAPPEGLTSGTPQALVRPPQSLEDVYVKSMRMGQADVLNDGLHLDEQPQQPLVIVIGSNPGAVEGRVVNARKEPVSKVTVVLIPEGGIRFRVDHKFTATDTAGRFRLERIPPGDYKLFAWRDVESGSWQDPEFVRPYETRGKVIHIEEGRRQTNVEVVSIP